MDERHEIAEPMAPPTSKLPYEPPRLEAFELRPEEVLLICLKVVLVCTPTSEIS